VSRSGELSVLDLTGRERERYKLPYGAVIPGQGWASIKAGQTIANWDPHNIRSFRKWTGFVRFIDFVEGITVVEKTDELTGLASRGDHRSKRRGSMGKDLRPIVRIVDGKGKDLNIPGTTCRRSTCCAALDRQPQDGAAVGVGDVVTKVPQEASKTRDITGGLREWPTCSKHASQGSRDPGRALGIVSFGKDTKGKQR